MTDKTKPISASNPPESRGTRTNDVPKQEQKETQNQTETKKTTKKSK